jgi:hypothetical protein
MSKATSEIGRSLAKLAESLLSRHLGLAIAAAEWRIRIEPSDIVDTAMVARLKQIKRHLTPRPPVPPRVYIEEYHHDYDPDRSIDDLVEGAHPMVAQCFRDAMAEGAE